ncbi:MULTISPECIES: Rha family transcriptional regulator [unclassified Campylobacter]|uniref:Rha family transcriptional regulator n=1 Tax=unclassified Campylobacter TaxID=2593542 RepID=UPI0021E65549|nr:MULTISPECIES: Rha family transcriptional regulator [unclassified Campylobacter]EGK8026251.1 hypothetical protein [Campylobacter lari]MCR8712837.1 Rha family transcriptional regulator [Campylobacter sp. W0066.1]MCV3425429.1 Rha family transcriptional regulator [Campylobacter sp. IFREMER_LSEM_CL1085]MCV3443916.1 Rha family transcriptional regulator [Campylobacter sp. IFREMER_LSEM_CL1097]MCV3454516.1 Rha family transcriptional regulator [Campylobacter sp. FU_520]
MSSVLKSIRDILNELREIGYFQCKLNFELTFQVRKIDGFRGLAMGFTGNLKPN